VEKEADGFADMNVIMQECNFTSTKYSPDKTAVVNNVQVIATRPAFTPGSNAGVMGAAPIMGRTRAAVGAVVAGVVVGIVLLL
jgi:hypothetical protein